MTKAHFVEDDTNAQMKKEKPLSECEECGKDIFCMDTKYCCAECFDKSKSKIPLSKKRAHYIRERTYSHKDVKHHIQRAKERLIEARKDGFIISEEIINKVFKGEFGEALDDD